MGLSVYGSLFQMSRAPKRHRVSGQDAAEQSLPTHVTHPSTSASPAASLPSLDTGSTSGPSTSTHGGRGAGTPTPAVPLRFAGTHDIVGLVWAALGHVDGASLRCVSRWFRSKGHCPGSAGEAQFARTDDPESWSRAAVPLRSLLWKVTTTWRAPANEKPLCVDVARVLRNCATLRKLTLLLPFPDARSQSLAGLGLLTQLRELRVRSAVPYSADVPFSGLAHLALLPALDVLELEYVDLMTLPVFPSVRELCMLRTDPRSIGRAGAERLLWPKLAVLELWGSRVSVESIAVWTRSKTLRTLMLRGCEGRYFKWWAEDVAPSELSHSGLRDLNVDIDVAKWGGLVPKVPCPAALERMAISSYDWTVDTEWPVARWLASGSTSTLHTLDLRLYEPTEEAARWLESLGALRRLRVGTPPAGAVFPGLRELCIDRITSLKYQWHLDAVPRCAPHLQVLWLCGLGPGLEGHVLAQLHDLRCLIVSTDYGDADDNADDDAAEALTLILDGALGCRCPCPGTLRHLPKLRLLRYRCPGQAITGKPWQTRAEERKIVLSTEAEWESDNDWWQTEQYSV